MSKRYIDHVVMDADHANGDPESGGAVQYEGINMLAAHIDDLHVWIDETHYIAVGKPGTIEEGDVFYQQQPEHEVIQVQSVDESATDPEDPVEVTFLYPPTEKTVEIPRQKLVEPPINRQNMGYTGPPWKLEKQA